MGVLKLRKTKETEQLVDELRQDTFLAHFPKKLTDELAKLGEIEKIPNGTSLVVEGEVNTKLYILLSGEVEVHVGGETVATLRKKGEVIGEMSMIAETPCSATVKTVSDCELLSFSHKSLGLFTKKNNGEYAAIFHKVFAKVLTERLVVTNDKARKFEKANLELKKLHRELDEINQKRLEEIYQSQKRTFKTIDKIYRQDLYEVFEELSRIDQALAPEELKAYARRISEVRSQLQPLAQLYSSEKALASKRVLLAEPDKKQQRIAKMALRGSGLDLDIASTKEEVEGFLAERQYDILLVSEGLLEITALAHQSNPEMKLVLMTSENVSTYIQYLKDHPYVTNIVSRNEEDRTFTVKNIFTTVGKLSSDDIFGMQKYLSWGADVQAIPVRRSEERKDILDKMANQFEEFGIRGTVIDRCRLVGEEMLMNAIYDAPVDSDGKPLFNHLDRTKPVVLSEEQQGIFRFACDGMIAALSIEDPFGAFKKEILMSYLDGCYAGKKSEMHKNKGGGGMGIHLIVETSDLSVFNVQIGFKTEVIALFNVDKMAGDMIKTPSFHLFYR